MQEKTILTAFQVLGAYILLNVIRPSGWMAYLVPIILWSYVAIIMLYVCGFDNLRQWFIGESIVTAIIIAIFQIVVSISSAFLTSFGKSPYAFTPTAIAINMAYFTSALFGMELSRAYLIKSCPKRKIFAGIASIALFYTFISLPLTKLTSLNTLTDTVKFLSSDLLPALAQSLLATYLALIGGPTASIAYLGTLQAFEWLSPILPNPAWTIKALINTLIPTIGFLTINQTVSPFKLMQVGIISRSEATGRIRRAKKSISLSWTTIAIIAVILVWGSTGLLGFQPNIIASGSMRPTLEVGDIAVTVQTSPEAIKIGDIIQYWKQGEPAPTIHRAIEIYKSGATTYIVTKGDANTAPDDPITPTGTVGKVIFVIPKLGWISIHLKAFIADAWAFFTNNPAATYTTLGITLISSAYGIHRYRDQPLKKLRRRMKR